MIPALRSIVVGTALALLTAGSTAEASSVILSASPNPTRYGEAATRITFYQGVSVVGIAPVAFGTAALTTASLSAGRGALTAYYSGDAATRQRGRHRFRWPCIPSRRRVFKPSRNHRSEMT